MKRKRFFVAGMLAVLTLGFIGCDNGNNDPGDITAPTLSLQAVAQYIGTADGTTAKVIFTSNEAGSYYVQVLSSETAAPAAPELAESGITGTVAVNTEETFADLNGLTTVVGLTGLTKDSSYKAHVTVKDAAGNYSAVWSSKPFTPTQRTDETNPFIGTWIMDKLPTDLPAKLTEVKIIGTEDEWEVHISGTSPAPDKQPFNVKNCWGTYDYSGYPAIWVVTEVDPQFTTLKVGDTGIGTISGVKMEVFNFVEPYANGTYTKKQ
jgi:hypothetical protein